MKFTYHRWCTKKIFNIHNKLKFTLEAETNKQTNFLYITVIIENNTIKTEIFRKKHTLRLQWTIIPYIYSNKKKEIAINNIDRAIK